MFTCCERLAVNFQLFAVSPSGGGSGRCHQELMLLTGETHLDRKGRSRTIFDVRVIRVTDCRALSAYDPEQPSCSTPLMTTCTSAIFTAWSWFRSFAADAVPRAWLTTCCTSEILAF